MIQQILAFVRGDLGQVPDDTEYGRAYAEALKSVEEFILNLMWENGIDDTQEEATPEGEDWGSLL